MKILTAKYVDGHLDVPEGSFQEGDVVTLLVSEAEEEFSLTADERSRLQEAIAQAELGEGMDGWQLLSELRD